MRFRKILSATLLSVSLAALAGCDNSEQRAEKYYQSGLAYLAQGDVDRALVELRNVFRLNGQHVAARRTYAEIEHKRGNLRAAFAQYLRLVEQKPDDLDALQALAEIAIQGADFETGLRHARAGLALAPDNATFQALTAAAEYGVAVARNDVQGQLAAITKVRALRETFPDSLILRQVVIDDRIRAQDFTAALAELDAALKLAPDNRDLHAHKVSVLSALGDKDGVEAALKDMVARFPGAPEIPDSLVRWYVANDELDKAEAFLRGRIDASGPDDTDIFNLVRFVSLHRGVEAALAELDRFAQGATATTGIRAARAGYRFDLGQRDAAIAEMKAILASDVTPQEARRVKVGLARMLSATGQANAAQSYVEEVLAEDSGDVEALKLKASWLIAEDQIGDAIAVLRRALDSDPNDAQAMTLMAQAHERDGNRELMREMLARAVDASGRAPDETLRYAQFLAGENKLLPAESILIDALRLSPGEPRLLSMLGRIYLALQDWPRAEAVAAELEGSSNPRDRAIGAGLRAEVLSGQRQTDEAIGYLQALVQSGDDSIATRIAIIRAHLAENQTDRALAYADQLVAEAPGRPEYRYIRASLQALVGQNDKAEATFRELVAEDAGRLPVWLSLISLVGSDPARQDEAERLIDTALKTHPDSGELKWAKAGRLEKRGDFDGAIAIYEDLYRANSGNPIVANNLASLLSNHRTDSESLDKAEIIARRLRGSNFPAYQDTYGWIAYLRGNYDEALAELEPAAAALDHDPAVQYHLAMTYVALGRSADALARLVKVEALSGGPGQSAGLPASFLAEARQKAEELRAQGVTIGN